MAGVLRFAQTLVACGALLAASSAAALYDEATGGDLAGDPLAPTALDFSPGPNVVTGMVTSVGDPRDYWQFTIEPGESLVSIEILSYQDGLTGGPANSSFAALHPGTTSAIPSGSTIAAFLGGVHVDRFALGRDLLSDLSSAPFGGTGFSTPLGSGDYTFLIQQLDPQRVAYSLDFVVVPEPSGAMLVGLGLGLLARRRECV